MTRTQYITRTLAALCGERPARPDEYHAVTAMADRLESGAPDALSHDSRYIYDDDRTDRGPISCQPSVGGMR